MLKRLFVAGLAIAPLPLIAAPPRAEPSIAGSWTNPAHSVTVRIAACGGGAMCGRVISASPHAKAKAADAGTPHLIGAELMSDLSPSGPATWRGQFFVPDRNVRAGGELRMIGPRTIEIEGCALGGLLCKTQQWTRVGTAPRARKHR